MAAKEEKIDNESEIIENIEVNELLKKDRFKCKIDSNVEILEVLHQTYHWIPGKENVRPHPNILGEKLKYINNIQHFYGSESDYIFETVDKRM